MTSMNYVIIFKPMTSLNYVIIFKPMTSLNYEIIFKPMTRMNYVIIFKPMTSMNYEIIFKPMTNLNYEIIFKPKLNIYISNIVSSLPKKYIIIIIWMQVLTCMCWVRNWCWHPSFNQSSILEQTLSHTQGCLHASCLIPVRVGASRCTKRIHQLI